MLTYAFQALKQLDYDEIASEDFEEIQDLFAAILAKGVAQQLKQGLYREYITKNEELSVLRGKIDIPGTIRLRINNQQRAACEFDEFSENNLYNQILKATMHYLLRATGVKPEHKTTLKTELMAFDTVEMVEPSAIAWNRLHYQRNNLNYELLLNVCYFVLVGMLQTTEQGGYRMSAFSDEHMARLFERFILEYYRKNHNYLTEANASQVEWDLCGDTSESAIRFLPTMQTDIMLRLKERVLIIDAKYYGKTLQHHYDKYTLHSGNIYQIYAYVKNQDKKCTGDVAGLLLYAKTDEEITPDVWYNIGGNMIGARTLDLNKDFVEIAKQLDLIASNYFNNGKSK